MSPIVRKIKDCQKNDRKFKKLIKKVEGVNQDFSLKEGVLWYRNHFCLPNILELKGELLKEAHDSTLVTHPGSTKMY